ncbi:uncharacterized protein LOC128557874 [Mercenaria mercenaria]|uniref:uncharacterized protein LOC128557874 n=1 Tax=Mercenaria mercenaria TaxID=6596 RepID=UPI00234E7DA0|nr:uncharacterized protein LOC128557874 [Mercenaria mercenaria]
MALQGKTIFIPGGCGTVGTGLTRTFLQNGARVAVSSRTQERLDEFKKSMDQAFQSNIILIKEDVSSESGAKNALEALIKQGGVQHVVACMGAWWQGGSLTKQSVEEFDKAINDRARSHFICAKIFLPYLVNIDGSTYTITSGSATEHDWDIPDISLIIVAGGCVYGISQAAQTEFKDTKVAVNEVRIGMFIQPKLDKDLEKRSFEMHGYKLDIIGNDIIADFMLNVLLARAKGTIKINSRKELEEEKKKLKK